MVEKEAFGAMQKLNQSWYEAYQTVTQSTFDIQGRSVQYAQSVFADGIETLKGHIETAQHWLQTANKLQEQQEPTLSLIESGVEAYIRNVTYMQRTFEHGLETIKGHTEAIHDLAQTLIRKAQEQQNMLWP